MKFAGCCGSLHKHKDRVCSPIGIFLILLTIVAFGIFTPIMTVGAEFYTSSSAVVDELEIRLDTLQQAADHWNTVGKSDFSKQDIQAWLNDKNDLSGIVKLTETTEPAPIDLYIFEKSKIKYDVLRYVIEIDYPENGKMFNSSGILKASSVETASGSALVQSFNNSKSDLLRRDYGRLQMDSFINNYFGSSTFEKICLHRYHGTWDSINSVCTTTTYADNLCFISDYPQRTTLGFGCYYNTLFFLFDNV
eukprot:NODE_762_length_4433_cov_0.172127.p2 type:complete len:249 gc:universal NODE_762_length_4433_cov_0.172127:3097-3843(+)